MGETCKHVLIDRHSRNILWANILRSTAKSNPEMGTLEFILALNKSYERMKKQVNLSGYLPQLLKIFFGLDIWNLKYLHFCVLVNGLFLNPISILNLIVVMIIIPFA